MLFLKHENGIQTLLTTGGGDGKERKKNNRIEDEEGRCYK